MIFWNTWETIYTKSQPVLDLGLIPVQIIGKKQTKKTQIKSDTG